MAAAREGTEGCRTVKAVARAGRRGIAAVTAAATAADDRALRAMSGDERRG